jgi:hypothetical protein
MENNPSWEGDRFSASHDIPRILRNPKFNYCIRKNPPPVHILSQINPVHGLPSYFLKTSINIIFPSMPRSFMWPLFLRPHHQNPVWPLLSPYVLMIFAAKQILLFSCLFSILCWNFCCRDERLYQCVNLSNAKVWSLFINSMQGGGTKLWWNWSPWTVFISGCLNKYVVLNLHVMLPQGFF